MRGIDIYHGNGWPFNSVTQDGYDSSDFVIIKATQGTEYKYTDYFTKAVTKALNDGKLVGAYHYAAGRDAVKEADYFIETVSPYIGKIILALDWEENQNKSWGSTTWAKKFVNRVKEKTGINCFLYANMGGISQCVDLKDICPLWFAGYPTDKNSWSIPSWPKYYKTAPWTHYTIWQFTSSKEKLDRNVSNMTKSDWYKFGNIEFDNHVTAQDIINIMYSWRGLSKKDRSHKVIIDLYNSYSPLPRGYKVTYTDNYCATTISAAFIKANAVDLIGGVECSVERLIDDCFKKIGIWEEDGTITPKSGYIICYNWDDKTQPNDGWADHIGIVVKVENGVITVIEGNYDGEVKERKIKVGDGRIRGYAIPHYYVKDTTSTGENTTSAGEDATNLSKAQLLKLVADTMNGKYGKGDERRQKLGKNYALVQEMINHVARTDATTLAKEVINGDYGNGDIRKSILGEKYTAVQKAVNKLSK